MINKKITRPYKITTRFNLDELNLIKMYTQINGNPTIVSFIRECIKKQIEIICNKRKKI